MEKKITRARQVLADNLKMLKERTPDLDTQTKIEKRCGVSQSAVSQMLRADNPTADSPKLSQVEKVAGAFGLSAWQLLLDKDDVGEKMFNILMHPTKKQRTDNDAPVFSRAESKAVAHKPHKDKKRVTQ